MSSNLSKPGPVEDAGGTDKRKPARLHASYKDRTADVTIVSNDNVHFRVHSFYLQAAGHL